MLEATSPAHVSRQPVGHWADWKFCRSDTDLATDLRPSGAIHYACSRCVALPGDDAHIWRMVQWLPAPDPEILALRPWGDGRLFADALHCVFFDRAFEPDQIAMSLIRLPGDRPKDTASTNARAFQLFLTLASRRLPITMNCMHGLRRVLDLDVPIHKRAEAFHAVYGEACGVPKGRLSSAVGVSARTLDAIRRTEGFAAEVAGTAAYLATKPERPFDGQHYADGWAPDEARVVDLAMRVIAHVRAAKAVVVSDRLLVFDLIDLCRWRGTVAPEALLSALTYVTGVVSPRTGEPTRLALKALWGTLDPPKFRRWAVEDAESEASTGRLALHGEWFERDRTATNFRAKGAFQSLKAERRLKL